MSTENTGTGEGGTVPGSENGVGLGAGEANTFEPEEGTEPGDSSARDETPARGETSVATAEDTPDVEQTPVETTEPS